MIMTLEVKATDNEDGHGKDQSKWYLDFIDRVIDENRELKSHINHNIKF